MDRNLILDDLYIGGCLYCADDSCMGCHLKDVPARAPRGEGTTTVNLDVSKALYKLNISNQHKPLLNYNSVDLSFPQFRKLAPEVRCMIWEISCSVPRFVDLWGVSIRPDAYIFSGGGLLFDAPWVYKSHARVPAILHTCQEARSIGLKYYTPSFDMALPPGFSHKTDPSFSSSRIYVHWEVDILCPIPVMEGAVVRLYSGKGYPLSSAVMANFMLKWPLVQRVALTANRLNVALDLLERTKVREISICHEIYELCSLAGIQNVALQLEDPKEYEKGTISMPPGLTPDLKKLALAEKRLIEAINVRGPVELGTAATETEDNRGDAGLGASKSTVPRNWTPPNISLARVIVNCADYYGYAQ